MLDLQELEEARKEAAALVELLDLRQGSLAATLDGGFPELRDTGGCSPLGAWCCRRLLCGCMRSGRPPAVGWLGLEGASCSALEAPPD